MATSDKVRLADPAAEVEQAKAIAARYRCEYVDLREAFIDHDLFRSIPVILSLLQSYPREALLAAFEQALQYNTFSYRFLCGLLSQQEPSELPEPVLLGQERVLPQLDVKRGLESYQTLLGEVSHD